MKGTLLLLGALSFLGGSASAATIVVDPFTLPVPSQNVCTPTSSGSCTGIPTSNGSTDANVIFGTRWMAITQTSGTDADSADVNQGFPGALSFNNPSHASSDLLVRWNGNAADGGFYGSIPSSFGAAPIDITSGGTNTNFLIDVIADDIAFAGFAGYTLTVYTDATHYSTENHDLVAVNPGFPTFSPPVGVIFPFSGFTTGAGAAGPANFTALRAIDLQIFGYQALDLQIDFIEANNIPEPGTWVMMGVGLLGFGVLLRRRRA